MRSLLQIVTGLRPRGHDTSLNMLFLNPTSKDSICVAIKAQGPRNRVSFDRLVGYQIVAHRAHQVVYKGRYGS